MSPNMRQGRGKLDTPLWTLVRHSGFVVSGDEQFAQGLEAKRVVFKSELTRVNEAGGLLFETPEEAEQGARLCMYLPSGGEMVPAAPGTFSRLCVGGLPVYVPPLPPSQFLSEFLEVAGDVVMDFGETLLDLDEEVGRRVNRYVVELFKVSDPTDPGRAVRNIMSGMLWMFMLGREHAQRGYAAPVARQDRTGDGWVPDNLAEIFKEGTDGTD